jgi:CRP-like cAMP-binding protein
MERTGKMNSHLNGFSSGISLGGKVSRYRRKQNIYKQGAPAYTLFYIQEGGVRLTTKTKYRPSAVTAILGVGDLFGELCLAGYPLRMSTAVALTASSIRTINKAKMLVLLRKKNKTSNSLVAYLLSSVKKYQDHVADLLTSSAEQRLARVLLQLAHLDKRGLPVSEIPVLVPAGIRSRSLKGCRSSSRWASGRSSPPAAWHFFSTILRIQDDSYAFPGSSLGPGRGARFLPPFAAPLDPP